MNKNHIWVVEMKIGKQWKPTSSAFLTRIEARIKKWAWQENNPDDYFRVAKYIQCQ